MINTGAETSATVVEWAMAELLRRPEIMQRLQDELNTVIGKDRLPQEADIPNRPFMNAIVKENFRLHPLVALNMRRESTQEFELLGFMQVRKDGNTMVCLMLAHLVYSFQWSLPPGEGVETVDMTEQFGLTVSLKTPLRLIAKANALY